MLKDRAQKATALRFCISKRWLPQLEVEVEPSSRIEKSKFLLTDLDVLGVAASPIGEQYKIVFDCKSGMRESAIGRAFWLHGVMVKTGASHGFVVLNSKIKLSSDHRMSAAELGVSLLQESEFADLAQGLGGKVELEEGFSSASEIDAWDQFLSIAGKYKSLTPYLEYSCSSFWVIKDAGQQCRRTVARLRSIRYELDPAKPEHMAVFGDAVCLFLVSISRLANRLFLVLMRPFVKDEFSSLLLSLLYGGYENYQTALKIKQHALGVSPDDSVDIFPNMERFEQLVREVVQAPYQALPAAILAREISFCELLSRIDSDIQSAIYEESPYAPKFVILAAEYLQKALGLPHEFAERYVDRALAAMDS